MGFIGDLFNGSRGAGFQAGSYQSQMPTSVGQANDAYGRTTGGLDQQQAFLNALAGQNGIGNQASVFGQQQNLANQLQQQAMGEGPNPALAQLAQTTGQNVSNQAALMAGQRGGSANAGLLARQIGQQGAGIQQNAVGQAATLRAQQQLAAQQALQQQQALMGSLAAGQVSQQQGGLNAYNQLAQGNQGQILGSIANQNTAGVNMQGNVNNANAGIAQGNQKFQASLIGDIAGAAGKGIGLFAGGGEVGGPKSQAGQFLTQAFAMGGNVGAALKEGGTVPGAAKVKGDSLKNDVVSAKLSPGEIVIPRSIAQGEGAPQKAAAFVRAILAKKGR